MAKPSSNLRILVVDDESFIRESLAYYLEDCDYRVTVADSAEEALDISQHVAFDVGVIDLRLPGMSGEALILELHKLRPAMRFIIHTGSVTFSLSEELKRIGVTSQHIFLKPVTDLTVIHKAILSLLDRPELGDA